MVGIALSLVSLGGAAYLAYQSRHRTDSDQPALTVPTTIDEMLEEGEVQTTSEQEIYKTLEGLHQDLEMEYDPQEFGLREPLNDAESTYTREIAEE